MVKEAERKRQLEATTNDPTNITQALEYIREGVESEATKQACQYAFVIHRCGADLNTVISMGVAYLEGYERALVNHKILRAFVPFRLKCEIKLGGSV